MVIICIHYDPWFTVVVFGYSQILGVDFSKNMFAHYECYHISHPAFNGHLLIYIECTQGMTNANEDDCIALNKCIYGLVQAARPYYKKAIEFLKKWDSLEAMQTHSFHVKKSAKVFV